MNSTYLGAITLVSLASFTLAKDTIKLNNGNVLIGDILPSEDSKVISLKHPAAEQPLKIKGDAVSQISFGTFSMDAAKGHREAITLANGDSFPCSVTAINADNVTFSTSFMGQHTIPRHQVAKIRFNNKPENNLYSGPGTELSDWHQQKSTWEIEKEFLVTSKRGEISRKIANTSQNYTIRFKAKWQNAKPRLKFYFSSNTKSTRDKKKDCYLLDINNIGLQMTRVQNNFFRPLGQIPLTQAQFKAGEAEILLQVDRKHNKLALYYNGRKLKDFFDTAAAPKGEHIIFQTLQDSGGVTKIGAISIDNWSGRVTTKSPNKDKSLANNDVLTDNNGRPMTGKIKELKQNADQSLSIVFNIAFAKEPLTLSENKVLTLEFQRPKDADKQKFAPKNQAQLAVGGTLSYDLATFNTNQLSVTHPILGDITVERKHLSEIAKIKEAAQK